MESAAPYRIWLAEDNPGDVRLFREALNNTGVSFELTVAPDGQKAIALVTKTAENQAIPRPHLIVLDINLPRHNGDEVLRQIRSHQSLDRIPVIMLTSSSSPADEQAVGGMGALYIQKPSDLDGLMSVGILIDQLLKG